MNLKRNKFSLRDCNPPEKKTRRKINELDFEMKFPFYDFDKDKIDLNLLRRFLYQNKIPVYYLYTEETIDSQMKKRKTLPDRHKKFLPEQGPINDRFEILDL